MLRWALIAFAFFIVYDAIWLGYVMRDFYLYEFRSIGRIENGKFQINYVAGAAVYVLLTLGLVFFVLPKIQNETLLMCFLIGALFGLIAYGVYDMTNMATLKDYSLRVALVDMAWGTFVCGAVTASTQYVISFFR